VGPHPAVAAIRHAVRASLTGLEPGDRVLVACSGGADSLALAAALAFEAPRAGLLAGAVTVDHGLQPGSAEQAERTAKALRGLQLDPVLAVPVEVAGQGGTGGYPGPEAAARLARYAALDQAADACGAAAIMLGHTLDDQAETVLLGLGRGSGARSLAGMAPRSGRYLRPLLGIRRAQTSAACAALGLQPWHDPQNEDPAFTRVRIRRQALPALEQALGSGVAEALARTASLLRADAEVLDAAATAAAAQLGGTDSALAEGWPAGPLAALPAAIRRRVLRAAAIAAGCPAGALSERHVAGVDDLVLRWHGQRWTDLPGGVRCERRYGRLLFTGAGAPPHGPPGTAAGSEDLGGRERHGIGAQAGPDPGGSAAPADP
jgi:tRNA(Ile)-lysidine synthase